MAGQKPNLLFIFSDQHTQKVAGCYGDPIVRTPNLDRLAAGGVTFDNVYTPAPICTPARMSLLTGQYPSQQRCWTNSDVLAADIPTFAHALGIAGYQPTLVGRLHAIGPDQLHGYVDRRVGDHSTNWLGGYPHDLGPLDKTAEPFRVSVERSGPGQSSYEVKDRDVTAAAVDLFGEMASARARGGDQPFAVTVGLMLPHQPYVCADADYALYDGKVGLPRLAQPAGEHPYFTGWRAHTDTQSLPDDQVIRSRTAYYGLVTSMDRMIGQILDALEACGLADNTLIIYSSDHGDQLGERNLWWKQTFYDDAAKVPLIMSWPGHLPAGEKRRQVANLIDVGATMIDATGGTPLPWSHARSLLPIARDGAAPWLDETFSEYCTDGMARWTGPVPVQQRMVRSEHWKLVYYHGARPQLFDLQNDPDEMKDLGEDPSYAGVRDALCAKVLSGWDPDQIAATMSHRRADKAILKDWARTVRPEEAYRWQVKVDDNWLSAERVETAAEGSD
ncbi:MAG: sulfatase-like hydrolase/transferase [Alphaproteobacteria bacterium]